LTYATSILCNWNVKQLKRLFGFSVGLFVLYFLFNISTPIMIKLSLIMLLTGIHVHLYMVRSERIPHTFPRPKRIEFNELVSDIVVHDEFRKLKNFHHHTTPIFEHVIRVSFLSYAVSKILRFDYRAAARGGLLHDFFLYDWRERKAKDTHRSLHGHEHPQIALANAKKHFSVNELEADIIVKHMYPKTKATPKYKESFLVSIMDKISTIYEYMYYITHYPKR